MFENRRLEHIVKERAFQNGCVALCKAVAAPVGVELFQRQNSIILERYEFPPTHTQREGWGREH